jgi:hypothetical protein
MQAFRSNVCARPISVLCRPFFVYTEFCCKLLGGKRMNPVIYLRIASVLTLLHAILHTIGGVFGKPQPGPQQAAVEAMKSNTFPLMGATRSFWAFYRGFGLGITIFLLAIAIVLWQLSSLARTDSYRLTPVYWTLLVTFLLMAANSYIYFFPPPVIVEVLIAVCIAGAIFTSKAAVAPS